MVLILGMIGVGSGSHYLQTSGTEGAALEMIVLKEMETKNWDSILIAVERIQEVVFKQCNQRYPRGRL